MGPERPFMTIAPKGAAMGAIIGAMLWANSTQMGFSGSTEPSPASVVWPEYRSLDWAHPRGADAVGGGAGWAGSVGCGGVARVGVPCTDDAWLGSLLACPIVQVGS